MTDPAAPSDASAWSLSEPCQAAEVARSGPGVSRRGFVVAAMGLLAAGCSSANRVALPGPAWPRGTPGAASRPLPGPATPPPASSGFGGVIARSEWAGGEGVPALMNRMLPIQHITIHHDGMSPFYESDPGSARARLESIRRAHRSKDWGDIGYHFAIDPAGRVWECRPIGWQGAHVKDHNEGNIGVLAMGNFDLQTAGTTQVNAVVGHVRTLMSRYGVSAGRVRTHQEWAATACPGRSMQSAVNGLRTRRAFG